MASYGSHSTFLIFDRSGFKLSSEVPSFGFLTKRKHKQFCCEKNIFIIIYKLLTLFLQNLPNKELRSRKVQFPTSCNFSANERVQKRAVRRKNTANLLRGCSLASVKNKLELNIRSKIFG